LNRSSYIFTSESVSEGHPDKVADRISDTVVDAFLSVDPEARVACETLVTTNRVVLAGEVRAGKPDGDKKANKQLTKDILGALEPKVRAAIKDIGYEQKGFHWQKAKFANYLHGQSAHIAQGVDATEKKDEGAGDQGIMFGYASTETPELMPATLQYSHNVLKRLAELRHSGELSELEPDAKSQVTLEYDGDGRPVRVVSIVVSHQHKKKIDGKAATSRRVLDLIKPHILPVHGGGAFSGKDPTKVDRSAAYACRYLAKNVVASGLADRCTIQIAYAIGVAQPVSFHVDLHRTGKVDPAVLEKLLPQLIGGATPRAIREHLQLNRPIYARTAAYGHFGRTPDNEGGFSWEKTDLVGELKGLA
jgi:S-adenosylmethionine synthetase